MNGSRRRLIVRVLVFACATATACGGSPTTPEVQPDLSGRWRGFAQIPTTALDTPLEMTLTDEHGTISGSGGGVDCRYFLTCGSFYSYTVTGSHGSTTVSLNGRTPEGRTWVLTGTISRTGGSMSGIVTGQDFPPSPWQMTKVP